MSHYSVVIAHLKIVPSTMISERVDCQTWPCCICRLIGNRNSNNHTQTYHEEHLNITMRSSFNIVGTTDISPVEGNVYSLQHAHIVQHHQCLKDIPDMQVPKVLLPFARPVYKTEEHLSLH